MYALVKFVDNVQYVCSSKNIIAKKDVTTVKYSDGRRYPANIIGKNDDKQLLQQILQNIHKGIPYIMCKKFDTIRIRNVKITKLKLHKKVARKNATIFTIAAENSVSDCNIKNDADRNKNNAETDTLIKDYEQMIQMKNCFHQGNANFDSNKPILDRNKSINYIDDNRKKSKTDTQNCDYLGKTDVPIVYAGKQDRSLAVATVRANNSDLDSSESRGN
ncbi:PREDICTED: uncharacterized protein LOC105457859 [Wasmannia auropunctata]|uniref:uncharacterized protein LOC105457859 n=1 Tax=Wasmannia auropunctata TaxID=64793 RepID=UPI0005EE1E9F|nr:PREDICTED: uncharacterized protein LOC105457859 [Wasmannia auropunctata]